VTRLRISIFPGGANAPLYLGLDRGWFAEAGLELDVTEVRSSQEQLSSWSRGETDVMHTAPDHLLRARRAHDPVAVRQDAFGELSVYLREGRPEDARWAVDDARSGFALVLRALLEDACGVSPPSDRLVSMGGTKQRFDALIAEQPEVDGTALHPPFDALAADAGLIRLAGHLDHYPKLATLVTVVRRADLGSDAIEAYLQVSDRGVDELSRGGERAIVAALQSRGLPQAVAEAGARGLAGPAGFSSERRVDRESLAAVAELRQRFDPAWERPVAIQELLETSTGEGNPNSRRSR